MSVKPKSSGRGCFFYGCLTVIVLCILGALTLYFGTQYAWKQLVNSYTSAAPAPMPAVEISDEKYALLNSQVTNFSQSLAQSTNGVTLVLSADDINALIQKDPENQPIKDKVFIRIEGDEIKGSISLPLDDLRVERLKGRYLNGAAGFNIAVTNGFLFVGLKSITINGKPLPAAFTGPLMQENLAKEINADPKKSAELQRFETIEIKDGKLIIKARPPSQTPAPAPDAATVPETKR